MGWSYLGDGHFLAVSLTREITLQVKSEMPRLETLLSRISLMAQLHRVKFP